MTGRRCALRSSAAALGVAVASARLSASTVSAR